MPRPEPYIESTANLNRAFSINFKSANVQTACTYAGFRSTSSMGARSLLGIAPEAVSCSIIFMIAGVAEPPNLALNFTPFQFHGLWLDVITTPPADPVVFTA